MGKTKLTYADPKLEIWICKDDVITSSGDLQAAYDDTGSWKNTWFGGTES